MVDSSTPSPTRQAVPAPTLDQYKAYLQDLGNIGTRYTTSNGFYLSIITALLGILALAKPGESPADLQAILRLAIPLFACLVCWVWFRTVVFYRTLFNTKFEVLRECEQRGGFFPAFEHERELFLGAGGQWLIKNEERIPLFLAAPFLVILVYAVLRLLRWI